MDPEKRHTKKYSFKHPDLTRLKELAARIPNHEGFQRRYGRLLSVLGTKVEDGLLSTLVQFYDPIYHCFTFRDYQLVPTLEEYSHLLGLPVNEKAPFSGFEDDLKPQVIAKVLSLDVSDIKQNLVDKENCKGLNADFLFKKAFYFVDKKTFHVVETIFALLMYGLVLFPDTPNFIDYKAIQIFMIGNPVPTLLADTYHSIHHKVLKGSGVIVCCAQLLRNWFVPHLPRSPVFQRNPDNLSWSRRIMSVTSEDVRWYNEHYDKGFIIDSCGEYANVPLIGTRGGITYNPVLAMRQFGYPMIDVPKNILLEGKFYLNGKESLTTRGRFVLAWEKVHKKDKGMLGKKNCVAKKPYIDWVAARVAEFKMPYPLEESIRVIEVPSSTDALFKTTDELKVLLTRMTADRDAWKDKFLASEREKNNWEWKYYDIEMEKEAWEAQCHAQENEIAVLKKRARSG